MSNSDSSAAAVSQDPRALVSEGYRAFDRMQLSDARASFQRALGTEPGNDDARLGLNLTEQEMVPRWHFSMLNDAERNDAYDAAIRGLVNEHTTVLDVGSGSGLLAMMAARAGARRVYTCEMNQPIAEMARRIVAENGFADRIKVIGKKSDELQLGQDLDEKVNLLITETLDSQLLGEGIIPIIQDARRRLLTADAGVIPCGATVHGALVESQSVWELNHVTTASGFDVSSFNEYSTLGAYPVRLTRFPHRFLTAPVKFCDFDFTADSFAPRQFDVTMPVTETGHAHAVAFWYDVLLAPDNAITVDPSNEDSHWKQAFQCFPAPVAVAGGREYQLSVKQHLTGFEYDLKGS